MKLKFDVLAKNDEDEDEEKRVSVSSLELFQNEKVSVISNIFKANKTSFCLIQDEILLLNSRRLDNEKIAHLINDLKKSKLWSQASVVENSSLLTNMSKRDIKLQESWFEIYKTEISYNKCLVALQNKIMPEFKAILRDYEIN